MVVEGLGCQSFLWIALTHNKIVQSYHHRTIMQLLFFSNLQRLQTLYASNSPRFDSSIIVAAHVLHSHPTHTHHHALSLAFLPHGSKLRQEVTSRTTILYEVRSTSA